MNLYETSLNTKSKVLPAHVDHIQSQWEKMEKACGTKFVVGYFKEVRLHVTRYFSGQPLTISAKLISLTKDGIPKVLGPMVPILREKDPLNLRLILTLLNRGRLVEGSGALDTTSIVGPPCYKEETVKEITSIAGKMFSKLNIEPPMTDWSEPHASTKVGPTGQALATALRDLRSLTPELEADLRTLGGQKFSEWIDQLKPVAVAQHPEPGKLRRVSVIRDKEMKNRPIAIFDYMSQTVLVPVHKALFKILRQLPCDLTFDQTAFEYLFKYNPGGIYSSLDLTSATDRFPVEIQERVMALLVGEEKAAAWRGILTREPFHLRDGGTVSYSTGQPMGGYSSWSAFTLCHHVVVHTAATRAGLMPGTFTGYALLGDDIVIKDMRVANHYKEIMSEIGVELSPTKSHTSKDAFEIAKRWFVQESECSPFPVAAFIEAKESPFELSSALITAYQRGWNTSLFLGVPGGDTVDSFLKALGWGRRSRGLRSIEILRGTYCLLLSQPNSSETVKAESMRLLASSFSGERCQGSYDDWMIHFITVAKAVKNNVLNVAYQQCQERIAQTMHCALQDIMSLMVLPGLDPQSNPHALVYILPINRVLGLLTQNYQAEMAAMSQEGEFMSYRDVMSRGAGLQIPDPTRIRSERAAKVVARGQGRVLHTVFKLYEEALSS